MFFSEAIWDFLSSEEPYTSDLEVWFVTENGVSSESVFACVFSSAQEAGHQVVANVELCSFIFVDLVFKSPEWPSFPVEFLIPFINSSSLFVCMINIECFEIINVKISWWKTFDIVLWLLSFLWRGGWFFFFWFSFLLLLLLLWSSSLASWLKCFSTHLNATKDILHCWMGIHSFSPLVNILLASSESSIKDSLETSHKPNSADKISKS